MSVYHLSPVGAGSNFLNVIEFDASQDSIIILGRNEKTFIDVEKAQAETPNLLLVSRNHVEIIVQKEKLYIKPVSRGLDAVYKNWKLCEHQQLCPFDAEDTITLIGKLSYFNYKLINGPHSNEENGGDLKRQKVALEADTQVEDMQLPHSNEKVFVKDEAAGWDTSNSSSSDADKLLELRTVSVPPSTSLSIEHKIATAVAGAVAETSSNGYRHKHQH